jgi:hypothetical protein
VSKKYLNPLRPWNPGRYTLEFTGYNRDFLLIQQYACDSLGCRSGDPDPLTDAKQDQTTGQRSFIHSLDLRPPQQNRPVMASFSSPFRTTYRYLVCLYRCFLLFSDGYRARTPAATPSARVARALLLSRAGLDWPRARVHRPADPRTARLSPTGIHTNHVSACVLLLLFTCAL